MTIELPLNKSTTVIQDSSSACSADCLELCSVIMCACNSNAFFFFLIFIEQLQYSYKAQWGGIMRCKVVGHDHLPTYNHSIYDCRPLHTLSMHGYTCMARRGVCRMIIIHVQVCDWGCLPNAPQTEWHQQSTGWKGLWFA